MSKRPTESRIPVFGKQRQSTSPLASGASMATRTVKPLGIAVDCSGVTGIAPPSTGPRRSHRLPVSPSRRLPLPTTASATASVTSPTPQRHLSRAISNESLNFPESHKSPLASAILQKRTKDCNRSMNKNCGAGQNTPPEFWAGPGEREVKTLAEKPTTCSLDKAQFVSSTKSVFTETNAKIGAGDFEVLVRPRVTVPAELAVRPNDVATSQLIGAGDNAPPTKKSPASRPNVLGLSSKNVDGFMPIVEKLVKADAGRPTGVAGKRCSWHSGDAEPEAEGDADGGGIKVDAVHTGRRVLVCGERAGTLRYFGAVSFEAGIWCGVALDQPEGLNDGFVKGRRYFSCAPNHGIFAPVDKVRLLSRPTKAASVSSFGVEIMSTPTPGSSTTGSQYLDEIGFHGNSHAPPPAITATISKQNSLEFDESLCSLGILTPSQIHGDFLLDDPLQSPVDVLIELPPSYQYLSDLDNVQAVGKIDKRDTAITPSLDVLLDESDVSEALFFKHQDASERTLSPEDLPMDPPLSPPSLAHKDTGDRARGGPLGSTGAGAAATSPGVESSYRPVATAFISSVTSVGSLDTDGYQGDGELSRPASRNTGVARMKTSGHDALTDSDFFTESDADGLEDSTGGGLVGVARGDRRAQVIDGTLYNIVHNVIPGGGQMTQSQHQQQHQRCPSFTASATEEMESSGIYSDLERRTDEPSSTASLEVDICSEETAKPDADRAGPTADSSPDATTDTLSSKSEPSTVNTSEKCAHLSSLDTTLTENNNTKVSEVNDAEKEVVGDGLQPAGLVGTGGSPILTTVPVANPGAGNGGKPVAKKYELKKHPMPKRNVESKIKAMLEMGPSVSASVEDVRVGAATTRRPVVAKAPKQGRWDAVMSKIAQGQADEKKRKQLKVTPATGASKENITPTPSPFKSKSRRGRTRASSSSSTAQLQVGSGGGSGGGSSATNAAHGSGNSSQRSSLSDISINTSPNTSKGSSKASALSHRSAKKVQRDARCQEGRISSPLSDHSIQSSASHPTPTRTPMRGSAGREHGTPRDHGPTVQHKRSLQIEKDAGGAMKTPIARKHKTPRDHNRFAVNKAESVAAAAAASRAASRDNDAKPAAASPGAARAVEAAQKVVIQLQSEQKRITTGYDALTLVIGHLVNYYDALGTPQLKAQLAHAQVQRTNAALELDEMSAKVAGLEHDLVTLKDTTNAEIEELNKRDEQEKLLALERGKQANEEFEKKVSELKKLHEEEQAACITKIVADHKEATDLLIASYQTQISALKEENKKQREEHKAELESVQRKSILIESLTNSEGEDLRLQASASKCTQLQKEVDSLRVVLDIRCQELQTLRHKHAVLSRDVEELTIEKKKVDTFQARVEDLESQLNQKREDERLALTDAKSWRDNYEHELVTSRKLSQLNEELNWTLQSKVRAFNQLKANVTHNSERDYSSDMFAQEWSSRSLTAPHSALMGDSSVSGDSIIANTISPGHQVSNILERSDSISWIYQLDNADDMAAKLNCMVPKKPKPSALSKHRKVANIDDSELAENWANIGPKCSSTPSRAMTDFHKVMAKDIIIDETICSRMSDMTGVEDNLSFTAALPTQALTPSPTNETLSLRGAAPVPKDAGGEAMVSEETSEEEDFPAC